MNLQTSNILQQKSTHRSLQSSPTEIHLQSKYKTLKNSMKNKMSQGEAHCEPTLTRLTSRKKVLPHKSRKGRTKRSSSREIDAGEFIVRIRGRRKKADAQSLPQILVSPRYEGRRRTITFRNAL